MKAVFLSTILLLIGVSASSAQQPVDRRAGAAAQEPSLVFEREVFEYPGRARRDPFQPLTGRNAGPLFEDLRLRIILFLDDPSQSLVTLLDAAGNTYRLRRGETVGNATIIDIGPTRVIFSVDDFGMRRQEVLELKATREGAGR